MCLDNLIGLRNPCGGDDLISPASGFEAYYVDDLPGIGIGTIDGAIDAEVINGTTEIQRQINLAANTVKAMVNGHIARNFNVASLVDNRTAGDYTDRDTGQSAQAFNVGVSLESNASNYGRLEVRSISLVTQAATTVTVKAWDLFDGSELATVDITTTVGGQAATVDVDWSFPSYGRRLRVFIGYDQTAVGTYQTALGTKGCSSCGGGRIHYGKATAYSRKVATGSEVRKANLVGQNGTSGLSVQFSVTCDTEYLLCAMKHLLAPAILYGTAEKLARLVKHSDRLSPKVISFNVNVDESIEYFEDQYGKLMEQALSNVNLPKDPCFRCDKKVALKVAIP